MTVLDFPLVPDAEALSEVLALNSGEDLVLSQAASLYLVENPTLSQENRTLGNGEEITA